MLRAGVKEGPLRIQHIKQPELPKPVSLVYRLERLRRAGEDTPLQRSRLGMRARQRPIGLGKSGADPYLRRVPLFFSLRQAVARLLDCALVPVEERKGKGEADDEDTVSGGFVPSVSPHEGQIRDGPRSLQVDRRPALGDFS